MSLRPLVDVGRRRAKIPEDSGGSALRIPVSGQEFAACYYESEQIPIDVVFRVRQVIGRFTGIPAEKILPDDDFQMFVRDNEEELINSLEQEFGLTITDSEAIKMRATVRSMSMVMANIVRGSPQL